MRKPGGLNRWDGVVFALFLLLFAIVCSKSFVMVLMNARAVQTRES